MKQLFDRYYPRVLGAIFGAGIVFAMVFLYAGGVRAQELNCKPAAAAIEALRSDAQTAFTFVLTEPQVRLAVNLYNNVPPIGEPRTFSNVVVFESQTGEAIILYGDTERVCAYIRISPPAWARLKPALLGRES